MSMKIDRARRDVQALSLDELLSKVTAFNSYEEFKKSGVTYTPTIRVEDTKDEPYEKIFLNLARKRLADELERLGHSVYRGLKFNDKDKIVNTTKIDIDMYKKYPELFLGA